MGVNGTQLCMLSQKRMIEQQNLANIFVHKFTAQKNNLQQYKFCNNTDNIVLKKQYLDTWIVLSFTIYIFFFIWLNFTILLQTA